MKFHYVLAVVFCAGCSSTGIIPMDKDMYMIANRNIKVPFTDADDEKADAYRQANEFCAKQGKSVETLKLDMTRSGFIRAASAALEFRCVLAGSNKPISADKNSENAK
jgi:hypothetical protein